jgi:Protein of unknown function (DUF3592)
MTPFLAWPAETRLPVRKKVPDKPFLPPPSNTRLIMALLRRLMNYKYRLTAFVVLSCVFGGAAFQTWRFGNETLSWKPTEGQITRRDATGPHEGDWVAIHIDYVVDSQTYHLVVTDQFIIKDHITIYYDPNEPGTAVVARGVDLVKFLALGFLACVGAFGVFAHLAFALWPQLESEESKYVGDIVELDMDRIDRFP